MSALAAVEALLVRASRRSVGCRHGATRGRCRRRGLLGRLRHWLTSSILPAAASTAARTQGRSWRTTARGQRRPHGERPVAIGVVERRRRPASSRFRARRGDLLEQHHELRGRQRLLRDRPRHAVLVQRRDVALDQDDRSALLPTMTERKRSSCGMSLHRADVFNQRAIHETHAACGVQHDESLGVPVEKVEQPWPRRRHLEVDPTRAYRPIGQRQLHRLRARRGGRNGSSN